MEKILFFLLLFLLATSCNPNEPRHVDPNPGSMEGRPSYQDVLVKDTITVKENDHQVKKKEIGQPLSINSQEITVGELCKPQYGPATEIGYDYIRDFVFKLTSEKKEMEVIRDDYDKLRKLACSKINEMLAVLAKDVGEVVRQEMAYGRISEDEIIKKIQDKYKGYSKYIFENGVLTVRNYNEDFECYFKFDLKSFSKDIISRLLAN